MKVIITKLEKEDFIKIIPENGTEIKELLKLGGDYKEILMGEFIDGSIGISCEKG